MGKRFGIINSMKKIALFGGSFNPPHIGHRKIIELVRDSFSCDEIWLMPSGDRRDKIISLDSKHRKHMAELFAKEIEQEGKPRISVSVHELEKINKTATIETLQELALLHPEHEFHMIVSSELVPLIKKTWVRGEELFDTAHFILVERPGSSKFSEMELPPLSTILIPITSIPQISSTEVREITIESNLRIAIGDVVADYIIKNKLYGFETK